MSPTEMAILSGIVLVLVLFGAATARSPDQ